MNRNFWRELGVAGLWAACLCGGLESGIACRPFQVSCLPYLPIAVAAGSILFFVVFIIDVGFNMLLLRFRWIRRRALNPCGIVLLGALYIVIGYLVAPRGGAF